MARIAVKRPKRNRDKVNINILQQFPKCRVQHFAQPQGRVDPQRRPVAVQPITQGPQRFAQFRQGLPEAGRRLFGAAVAPHLVLHPGPGAALSGGQKQKRKQPAFFHAFGLVKRPANSAEILYTSQKMT